jgi:predicted PurR-regulated permease PerM
MDISHRTIIFILIALASVWLVIEIRDILYMLFISFIMMSALKPIVEYFEKYHIPKILSIIFIYLVIFGIIGVAVSSLIPALVSQTTYFISSFPKYVSIISPYFQIDIKSLTQQIAPVSENVVKVTVGLFSNIFTTMTVLVFTFYLLLERKYLDKFVNGILHKDDAEKTMTVIQDIENNLGAWLRGEFILMLFIGIFVYIGLLFLRVDFALPLAIIAGFMEIVPIIGPIISGIPAVLVAMSISPVLGLATIALYFIVQQIENNLIVPFVMKRAVNMPPLVSIIALLVGSKLAGITGAILAIPIAVMLRSIILGFVQHEN